MTIFEQDPEDDEPNAIVKTTLYIIVLIVLVVIY